MAVATYTLLDTVSNAPPLRRKQHVRRALDQATPLFSWVGAGADGLVRLAEAENLNSDLARAAIASWRALVVGHAMDLYADAGMDALAWPQAMQEALHTLTSLRAQTAQPAHDWILGIAGVSIVSKTVEAMPLDGQSQPQPSNENALAGMEFRVLTMEDVERELMARSTAGALVDAQQLAELLPLAGLPLLAMATGAAWALAVAGRLTGYEEMTQGGGELDWQVSVRWNDTQEGVGPTGEIIED